MQSALAQTALVEAGALGLGALLVAALHTLVLDLTGLLFAGALAAVGLYVLPNRRRKARDELRAKVADLQQRLHETLSAQFEQEMSRSRAGHAGGDPALHPLHPQRTGKADRHRRQSGRH
ncbi:MAG: hypothetical protein V9H69_05845 [Anaerolineae bacterium]